MAQSDLSRRRSWTAGTGAGSFSTSSQWVRKERYGELHQLEQEAKRSMKEMKLLELEIREQSGGLEKLKKRDAQRLAKISELRRALEGKNEKERNGEAESAGKPGSEKLQEELARLEQDHADIQSKMEDANMGLELKRSELDRLAGHHRGLCEQIVQEEKALQAAELEESLQQSVAVQHEMRSLSEDLRRLGHLMDDFPPVSIPEQLKQNPAKQQNLRPFHRDMIRGTRSMERTPREGIPAVEHARLSLGEHDLQFSSRSKQPVEFEERESFNRKRHKNSSFEQELERLHEQRERLEVEAHEKQMLLESVTRFSSQTGDSKVGLGTSSRKGSGTPQQILSPSVVEGFKDSPSLGPERPASVDSSSASSDVSSEDTKVEKLEEDTASSIVKRLNFGRPSSGGKADTHPMLQHVGSGKSCISTEEASEYDDDVRKDHLGSVASGSGSVGSWSDNVKEQALMMAHGPKEGCSAKENKIGGSSQGGSQDEEDLTTGTALSEIDKLEEEVGRWGDGEIQEIIAKEANEANDHQTRRSVLSGEKPKEHQIIPEKADGSNDHETCRSALPGAKQKEGVREKDFLTARCHKTGKSAEMILESKIFENAEEAIPGSLDPDSLSSSHQHDTVEAKQGFKQQWAPNGDGSEAGEASASNDGMVENQIWRDNAETQIKKLCSQLSLLDQKVESELKLQNEMKKQEHLEQSTAATEQLNKQVSSFGDELIELRQSMLQLQQNLREEIESRSIAEHSVQQFRTICTEQSAKFEHLVAQVSHLAAERDEQLKLRAELEGKLEKEAQERLKVEAELKDLSQAVTVTTVSKERADEAIGELVQQQKTLLVNQLKEAEKLRTVAEVRVLTLDKQVEQLERVCDVAQNIQEVLQFQDKILKFGLQTLVQLIMLVLCVSSLYSRIAEAIKNSLIPT